MMVAQPMSDGFAYTSRITGPRETGRLSPLDPRTAAWRKDLADLALAELIAVPNYALAVTRQVGATTAALYGSPEPDTPLVSELLEGELFALLEVSGDWGWGYGLRDRYVGYIALGQLVDYRPADGEDGRIGCGDALIFPEPSIKAPAAAVLPIAAPVRYRPHDDLFVELTEGRFAGRFVHSGHLAGAHADWVDIAGNFIGTPYRWGGRSRQGIDCSGLVQVARQAAGHSAPRDSDMLAASADCVNLADARRGDYACWPGHIGVMLDESRLLHANAFHMTTLVEPLADVVARIRQSGGPEVEIRRPQV